jgi:hypothetical protein
LSQVKQPQPVDLEISELQKKTRSNANNCSTQSDTLSPSSSSFTSLPLTSYWDSPDARKLFQPCSGKTVQVCLQRRVELLNDAYNDWSKLGDIIDGGDNGVSEFPDNQKQQLVNKCLYLGLPEKTLPGRLARMFPVLTYTLMGSVFMACAPSGDWLAHLSFIQRKSRILLLQLERAEFCLYLFCSTEFC